MVDEDAAVACGLRVGPRRSADGDRMLVKPRVVTLAIAAILAACGTDPAIPAAVPETNISVAPASEPPPTTTEAAPPTSVEITEFPDGYIQSARELFPADARMIETQAADLFNSRLAFIAGASTATQPAIRLFVVRATPADVDAGASLSTSNVDVVVTPAIASDSDLREIVTAINNGLVDNGLADGITVSIEPLEQTITIGTPPTAEAATVEIVRNIARQIIDNESARIAVQRPDTIDVDNLWSTVVLRFATVTVQLFEDEVIG